MLNLATVRHLTLGHATLVKATHVEAADNAFREEDPSAQLSQHSIKHWETPLQWRLSVTLSLSVSFDSFLFQSLHLLHLTFFTIFFFLIFSQFFFHFYYYCFNYFFSSPSSYFSSFFFHSLAMLHSQIFRHSLTLYITPSLLT